MLKVSLILFIIFTAKERSFLFHSGRPGALGEGVAPAWTFVVLA